MRMIANTHTHTHIALNGYQSDARSYTIDSIRIWCVCRLSRSLTALHFHTISIICLRIQFVTLCEWQNREINRVNSHYCSQPAKLYQKAHIRDIGGSEPALASTHTHTQFIIGWRCAISLWQSFLHLDNLTHSTRYLSHKILD